MEDQERQPPLPNYHRRWLPPTSLFDLPMSGSSGHAKYNTPKTMQTPDTYDVRQSVTEMHCEYQMIFWLCLKMQPYTKSPT